MICAILNIEFAFDFFFCLFQTNMTIKIVLRWKKKYFLYKIILFIKNYLCQYPVHDCIHFSITSCNWERNTLNTLNKSWKSCRKLKLNLKSLNKLHAFIHTHLTVHLRTLTILKWTTLYIHRYPLIRAFQHIPSFSPLFRKSPAFHRCWNDSQI